MAGTIQTLITARDLTGAAFASARSGLAAITATSNQASGALTGLGAVSSATSVRVTNLAERIYHQERSLSLLEIQIQQTTAQYGIMAVQTQRQINQYDRLNSTINQNRLALDRLQTEQTQAHAGTTRMTSGVAGLSMSLGQLGIAFSGQQIGQWVISAGQMANTLEKTEATLKALIPDSRAYAGVVAMAEANQRLFGGTLSDNLAGLQGLAILTKTAKVDMAALNDASQRLAIKSPEQGSMGAMIALTELLTGKGAESTRSLRMRYELTAEGLAKIEAAPDAAGRIRELNKELERLGITDEVVKARLDTTAQSYSDLGIAVEKMKTGFGRDVTETFEPLVKWLLKVTTTANEGTTAIEKVRAAAISGDNKTPPAANYQEVVARIRQANAAAIAAGAPHSTIRPPSQEDFYRERGIAAPQGGTGGIWQQPFAGGGSLQPIAPIIVNIASTVVETQKITSLVQEGIRAFFQANGRAF